MCFALSIVTKEGFREYKTTKQLLTQQQVEPLELKAKVEVAHIVLQLGLIFILLQLLATAIHRREYARRHVHIIITFNLESNRPI